MIVPESLRRLPASWSDPGAPASEYCGHGRHLLRKIWHTARRSEQDDGCGSGAYSRHWPLPRRRFGNPHRPEWARSNEHPRRMLSIQYFWYGFLIKNEIVQPIPRVFEPLAFVNDDRVELLVTSIYNLNEAMYEKMVMWLIKLIAV
jgi:hypothetical protein